MNLITFNVHARDFIAYALRDDLAAARSVLALHPGLVHNRNSAFETPLHYLAIEGCCAAVELLISAGATVEVLGLNEGGTPLYHAAGLGQNEMARLLIANGADVHRQQTYCQDTPLHAAAQHAPDGEMIALLLAAGADIEARSYTGRTPLHEAVFMGNVATTRALLTHGANPAATDEFGDTPVQELSDQSPAELVTLLRGS
jgi:uncharacterized protein